MSSKHQLTLQITVGYNLNGTRVKELKARLENLANQALNEGQITGDSKAEVDYFLPRVIDDTKLEEKDDVNSPDGIGRWLRTLDPDDSVYIDEDGLSLNSKDDPNAYIEVGGNSVDEEED